MKDEGIKKRPAASGAGIPGMETGGFRKLANEAFAFFHNGVSTGLFILRNGDVWTAQGGSRGGSRNYPTVEAAIAGEEKLFYMQRVCAAKAQSGHPGAMWGMRFDPQGEDYALTMIGSQGAEIHFTVRKYGAFWKLVYDDETVGIAKSLEEVKTVMNHVMRYIGPILKEGRSLKAYTVSLSWTERGKAWVLLDGGKPAMVTLVKRGGLYDCYSSINHEGTYAALEEAQWEGKLRYLKRVSGTSGNEKPQF
jgi:hypothetical protein